MTGEYLQGVRGLHTPDVPLDGAVTVGYSKARADGQRKGTTGLSTANENKDKEDKDVHLKVVVNGKGVPIKASPKALLGSLVEPALEKANVADRSELDRWVFTNAAGAQLDKNQTVGSFNFQHNEELFLNLTAGVVG